MKPDEDKPVLDLTWLPDFLDHMQRYCKRHKAFKAARRKTVATMVENQEVGLQNYVDPETRYPA